MSSITSPSEYAGRWLGTIVVAGTGLGLTDEVAYRCRHQFVIAVNDAHLLLPYARVLYAADSDWWQVHRGVPGFAGERWSVLEDTKDLNPALRPRKLAAAERYGIQLVEGVLQPDFSRDPRYLSYGSNSGFQAINLAQHFGASRILLVGFNMDGPHFFGNHPLPLRNSDAGAFIRYFDAAAALHVGAPIVNCTPDSELKSFPYVPLEQALSAP